MKKIISFVLCLVLIFSLSVCSFGAIATSNVTVTNFPTYFTGQWDATIADHLFGILTNIEAYLPAIEDIGTDVNEVSSQFVLLRDYLQSVYTVTGLWQTRIETLLTEFDTFFREDFNTSLNSNFGGVISSVSSVRSAVSSFESHLGQDLQRNIFDYQGKDSFGYLVYMLQQVLADEDDLAFKAKNKDNEKAVIDFAETGSTNGNINYFGSVTSSIDAFGFLSVIFDIDYSVDESFEAIYYGMLNNDAWLWFTQSNKNDINGSTVSNFSARVGFDNIDDVEIVTDYLGENKRKLSEFLEGRGN